MEDRESVRDPLSRRQLGTQCQVLVERLHKGSSLLQGFSENYIPLLFSGPTNLIHQVVPVSFTGFDQGQPIGKITEELLEEKQVNK